MGKSGMLTLLAIFVLAASVWAQAAPDSQPPVPFSQRAAQDEGTLLLERVVQGQISRLDTRQIERVLTRLEADIQANLPSLNVRRMIFKDGGTLQIDVPALVSDLIRYFLREIVLNFRLLGQLLLLVFLCSALQHLQVTWERTCSVDLAAAVSFLVVLYMSLKSFQAAVAVGRETIERMVDFMQAIFPMLTALLAAAGAVTSATVLHPLLATAVVAVATVIKTLVFPMALVGLVLGVGGNLAKGFPGVTLADLANKAAVVLLGLLCTGFLGIVTVKGALAPLVDGVGLKTAKFLAGRFVPVIGGVFSGAVEVVAGGSVLIKSAVGVFGLFVVIVIASFSLLKLASILIIFRLAAALAEPVSDPRVVSALNQLANSLSVVLAAVGVTAVMFFVAISIVISLGNMAVMLQ